MTPCHRFCATGPLSFVILPKRKPRQRAERVEFERQGRSHDWFDFFHLNLNALAPAGAGASTVDRLARPFDSHRLPSCVS